MERPNRPLTSSNRWPPRPHFLPIALQINPNNWFLGQHNQTPRHLRTQAKRLNALSGFPGNRSRHQPVRHAVRSGHYEGGNLPLGDLDREDGRGAAC